MNGSLGGLDYTIIGVYLLAMLGLGYALSSRIRVFKDYFLAGGMLTTPILVCTLVSTYYELDVTFAVSESGFHYGIVSWMWLSRPYYVAILIAAFVLTRRLRRFSGCMTLPDVLEQRYGRGARITGALACFVYSLPITAIAGMTAMFQMLGWRTDAALAITIGICAAYTMMGGLWADAISDTIQFVLMCVSIAIALPLAVNWVGGFEFVRDLPTEHMRATGGLSPWLIVAWTVGALTVFVEPAFYQRIFAAENQKAVGRALLIGILLWAAYDWGVTALGMVGRAAVDRGLLPVETEGRQALLAVAAETLPIGLRGLFLGGVLAAAMSSVDSYSLLASTNLVYDIHRPLARRRLSERGMIRATRAGVFLVMLTAAIASLAFDRITDAWVFLAGVLASVVFVPVMAAMFFQPARAAGLASSAAGLIALIVFHVIVAVAGVRDEEAESYVLRLGGLEIWREYAVLFALPVGAAAFAVAQFASTRKEGADV